MTAASDSAKGVGNMATNVLRMIITVTTIDGVSRDHTYAVPDTSGILSATTKKIGDAMRRGRDWLILIQPLIVYRAANIVAIHFDCHDSQDQEEITRVLGFLQDRK